ncbi:MAG: Peptide methionine sulfoxide reductase msrA [Bacteroidetes bacterium]|jgi:peptide-methionine (S)-S-oxide reductase|nr:Peptide methionine sulfoxide reductase msrA [Bacteroidota bacterium]
MMHLKKTNYLTLVCSILLFSCSDAQQNTSLQEGEKNSKSTTSMNNSLDTITFGAGCFWCVEAVFQDMEGVEKVVSGYSGGFVKNPAYKEVCMGTTGHAEVCQVTYDPKKVTVPELLEVFWGTHDPTTLNRQGNDIGTQYRSAIFYHNEEQKVVAEEYKAKLDSSGAFDRPIVTEIKPFSNFYPAEDYHQDYFNQNGSEPYCQFVVKPKVEKFKKVFANKVKKK